jgi:cytidine deaminase
MKTQEHTLKVTVYDSVKELAPADNNLVQEAKKSLGSSYSPYSNFKVGAAALLEDGRIITGSNQENSSFGVTICAERVLLSVYSQLTPKSNIKTIAITYQGNLGKDDTPVSPCGICRQSLSEVENIQKTPIRVIMCGQTGKVWNIASANGLLPLAFDNSFLLDS